MIIDPFRGGPSYSGSFTDLSSHAFTLNVSAGAPVIRNGGPYPDGVCAGIADGDQIDITAGAFAIFDGSSAPITLTVEGFTWDPVTTGNFVAWLRIGTENPGRCAIFNPRNILEVNIYGAADIMVSSTGATAGAWNHWAVTRDGSGNCAIYLNGTRTATATNTAAWGNTGGTLRIAANTGSGHGQSRLSGMRISSIARYSGTTLTVPTARFTSDADTILLTNF